VEVGEILSQGNHQRCKYGSITRGQRIILNYVRSLMKNKLEKEGGKGSNFFKSALAYLVEEKVPSFGR
jgi:hypothetical protein